MDWTEKFQNVLTAMEKTGKDYAQKKSLSWSMQELTSSIKSSLMMKALSENPEISVQKAEMIAKASSEYKNHIEGTKIAMEDELIAKAKYEKLFSQFEAYRSLISLDKKTGGVSA